jgi:hypothetical protein
MKEAASHAKNVTAYVSTMLRPLSSAEPPSMSSRDTLAAAI